MQNLKEYMRQKPYLFWNHVWSFVIIIGLIIGIVLSDMAVCNATSGGKNIDIVQIILFIITSTFLLISAIALIIINNITYFWYKTIDNLDDFKNEEIQKQIMVNSFLTLQIPILIDLFKKWNRISKQTKSKWWKFNIRDITMMGLLLALFCILELTNAFVPSLPFYITFSFKFIPLFFMSYLSNWFKTFILCSIAAGLRFLISPTSTVGSGGALAFGIIFDYIIPYLVISLGCFIKPIKIEEYKVITWSSFMIFISIPMFLIYVSRVISGAVSWGSMWDGVNAWLYSIIFNIPNAIADYVIFIVIIPSTFMTLEFLKRY